MVQLKSNVVTACKLCSSNDARICRVTLRTSVKQQSKNPLRIVITQCMILLVKIIFSSGFLHFKSVLLYSLNTQSYENCHNSLMVKDLLICKDFLAWHVMQT